MKLQQHEIYDETSKSLQKYWCYKYKGYYILPVRYFGKDVYELISPNYIRINRGNAGIPKTLEEAKNVISSRIESAITKYEQESKDWWTKSRTA